ncbi:MAG: hypothetical protein ACD_16C00082G0018 [uncultured bacterium]|nr:MAG: hypothetical protein ACD_16C00082G0018 [uncultured bacterium]OFW69403.1 MAG: hypothetical protein A2X70_00430 [Alphaproteobacteria bacterium GWC2_42_16]OFW74162.1 MAG: hypothetical protein A2Z80_01480 [Alphaproteobacteria bacterium GWA2_41_27]OFW84157.1 MAG: hypothetical protein A3E50_00610 [Alphaproteobacteria bacterium RIFCSPHIGHO2_12_FULL_42_100]OFW84750.1 MAG: hypothetical protein A2W06_01485 [Alphaproteobacteria bacterium RBG_16_42_14]OFW90878.1 MAG: hypothetical protein A2W46_070
MSDFLRELEEDIQEQRIYDLWHKYGNYVIALALAIVIATTGYTLWKYMAHQSKLNTYLSFSKAVTLYKQGKTEEALKAFQSLAQEKGGYAKLARLYEAALLSNSAEIYTEMAQQNVSDPALGNLTKVLGAARTLSSLTALQPLTAPNNAWAPLSYELLGLEKLRQGDEVAAAKDFLAILEESYASPYEQVRASMMLSQIDVPASFFEKNEKKEK